MLCRPFGLTNVVDSRLGALPWRQAVRQHLDAARVRQWHVDVHVEQEDIGGYARAAFTADSGGSPPVSNKIPRAVPRKHSAQCNQLPGQVTPPQRLGAGHGGKGPCPPKKPNAPRSTWSRRSAGPLAAAATKPSEWHWHPTSAARRWPTNPASM